MTQVTDNRDNDPHRLPSVCPDCGRVFNRSDRIGRCDDCQPRRYGYPMKPKTRPTMRGYDSRWRRLSERARAIQQYCSDCGITEDLTADHTPEAWERRAAGKTIRLQDIDVVCRSCNATRGAARGSNVIPINRDGRLHHAIDRCPVCRADIRPNDVGMISAHTIGNYGPASHCPMSGKPFPDSL